MLTDEQKMKLEIIDRAERRLATVMKMYHRDLIPEETVKEVVYVVTEKFNEEMLDNVFDPDKLTEKYGY